MRVIVTGRLCQCSYEAKDGIGKRTVYELQVDEVGPSLRNATVKVGRVNRSKPADGSQRQGDPWASEPANAGFPR